MTTLGSGHYTYTVQENWAKLPEGETFAMVSAIATDSQDRVYAFQRKEPPVLIFDRDGNLQDSWGNGSFLFAHGFYIEDDVVYVTDRDASTCLVYTLDGKPVQMLGRHGRHSDTGCEVAGDLVPRAAGPFNYPAELVPSPSGELYVADGYRNSRVHRFTSEGELIQSWGEPGKSEANHFHLPHSLIIDGDRIIVCDRGKPPHPALHTQRRVHRVLERHPAPHGHLPRPRGQLPRQRGHGERQLRPHQHPRPPGRRAGPLRLSRLRPWQLDRLPRRHLPRRRPRRHRQVRPRGLTQPAMPVIRSKVRDDLS